MTAIPRESTFDSSLALLSDGYTFISKRCRRHKSDLFETRLMLRKVVCTTGVDAAKMFYVPNRFTRQGAMPITTLRLLQDEGSVATLDAEAHRHRKQMFMNLMTPAAIDNLTDICTRHWRAQVVQWAAKEHIVLHDAAREVLCRAICEWTGVHLGEDYPFFPFIGGRVRRPFEWQGHHFAEETWVLLDLYGTNHDPHLWDDADRFRPERFAQWDENAYDFIPQGGGEFIANHRCAGEWITVHLLETTVSLLVNHMRYHVPAQDLSIDLSQMPALPQSGFVMAQVGSV